MTLKKWIMAIPALILTLFISVSPVLAIQEGEGRIVINYCEDGELSKPVSGGMFNLVRVADYNTDEGTFTLAAEFAASQVELVLDESGGFTAEQAKKLADFNAKRIVKGTSYLASADGQVIIQNVQQGVYLCTNLKAASGYDLIEPFLIAMPSLNEEGVSSWDLTVKGKVGKTPATAPTPETPDNNTPGGSTPGTSDGPTSATKPSTAGSSNTSIQTYGMYWLIALGFGLAGFAIIRKSRKSVR